MPLLLNQLEPTEVLTLFRRHPPRGFEWQQHSDGAVAGTPAFVAPFDLLTTADEALKRRTRALPGWARWSRWLQVRTAFIGTTVSEYALFTPGTDASAAPARWKAAFGRRHKLLIVKDIPQRSPLLSAEENAFADALAAACERHGYLLVEGQALAYVPITFDSIDAYLAGLSISRRKNLKRKLRSRADLTIERIATGAACFDDKAVIDRYYALYRAVFAQSEIHFDELTRDYFAGALRAAGSGGIVFEYRRAADGLLIGWNLCFEFGGKLVDKTIGFAYPEAREANLYFVSWMVNLEYAIERGLTHYIAGWTDPEVKAQLGARFTMTRHAVYVRNPLLRALARRFVGHFESDANVIGEHA